MQEKQETEIISCSSRNLGEAAFLFQPFVATPFFEHSFLISEHLYASSTLAPSFEDVEEVIDEFDFDNQLDATQLLDDLDGPGFPLVNLTAADKPTHPKHSERYNCTMCKREECKKHAIMKMAQSFGDMDQVQGV